jgi:hypothetical protein
MIAHGASIMEIEIRTLRKANELLSKRKQRKRKVLKGFVSQSIADGLQLVAQSQNQDIIDQTSTADNGLVRR